MCVSLSPPLRCDAKKRRYTGAVCGLGYDPMTGQSLHQDHDIELTFDTLLSPDDLDLVHEGERGVIIIT